jgi:dihydroxyacetone synthase
MHLAENTTQANGATDYGKNVVEGLKKEEKVEAASVQKLSDDQDHVLKSFRLLIADLCQQFNGGHPGYVVQSLFTQSEC